MITFRQGNLLEAPVDALVNTVNTVGVMGKGIALMFKEAFPENFRAYEKACEREEIKIGQMFVTENTALQGPRWLINFPTKKHWRHPSKLEWIVDGLRDLRRVIEEKNIRSVALPPLGCGNGGLDWGDVRPQIELALTLRDLDRAIQIARARPPEVDFRPLDPGSYGIGLPGGEPTRVTTDAGVFEFSSDNFQLFSPGGEVFGAFCVDGGGESAEGRGIAWMVQRPGAEAEFVVATRFGPRTVESFEEMLAALDVVGEPSEFPYANWPGVTVSVIA